MAFRANAVNGVYTLCSALDPAINGWVRSVTNGEHDLGLIAEVVSEVVPVVAAYEENGVDARSVDYPRLPVPPSAGVLGEGESRPRVGSTLAGLAVAPPRLPATGRPVAF